MRATVVFALLVLGLSFAMAARSQDPQFCETLTRIADDASNRFVSFKSNSVDEDGDFLSNVTLPGASRCYITRADAAFNCRWQGSVARDLTTEAKKFADALKTCYPSARVSERTFSNGDVSYGIHLSSVWFYVSASTRRNYVSLSIDRNR